MEWSNDLCLTFLERYQNEPCLWDAGDKNHKRKEKTADAWGRISSAMNIDIETLKKKKDSLMATFRGHLRPKKKSERNGSGGQTYVPICFAYSFMASFLAKNYNCHPTINTQSEDTFNEEDVDDPLAVENKKTTNSIPSPVSTQVNSQPGTRRKRNPPELQEAEFQMKEAFTMLRDVTKQGDKEDEYDLYGRMMAKKLRKLPEWDRETVIHDMNELLFKRMRQHCINTSAASNNSGTYPPPPYMQTSFTIPRFCWVS